MDANGSINTWKTPGDPFKTAIQRRNVEIFSRGDECPRLQMKDSYRFVTHLS